MYIDVVRGWPKPSVDPIYVEDPVGGPVSRVLYLPISRRADLISLDNVVHRLPPVVKHRPGALVLRAHFAEAEALNSDAAVEIRYNIARRIPETPVAILSWDGARHTLEHLAGPEFEWSAHQRSGVIRAVRHAELWSMVHQPGVLLPSHPNYHYLAPNGSHYKSYVRVANAFRSIDSVDAGVFWLLPHLQNKPIVVLDSASVLPLGLNCFRYKADSDGATTSDAFDRYRYSVECPRTYGEVDELAMRLRRIHEEAGDRPLLFLASVVSSGRFAGDVIEVCEQSGFERRETVSLFRGPTPMPTVTGTVFCILGEDFTRRDPKACSECDGGSSTVRLEGRTFSVEIAAGVSKSSLTIKDAAAGKGLLKRYAGSGLIKVHRDDRLRHHMIDLDLAALLESSAGATFRDHVKAEALKLVGAIDAVLAPTHAAAQQIARIVGECTGAPVVSVEQTGLANLAADDRLTLEDATTILFVDDVVVTGSRLLSYRNWLRDVNLMPEEKNLRCLVGIARPPSPKELDGICDMLHDASRFTSADCMFLPNWDRDECPWCLELLHLKRHSENFGASQLMRRRFERLSNTHDGLIDDLFIPWRDASTPGLRLGANAIFGMGNQPELFFSVALHIQRLRNQERLDETYLPPIAKTLDPGYWKRFYEPIIIACILRACRPHDVRSTLHDDRVRRILKDRFAEPVAIDLRSEMLYAIARSKLPSIHDAESLAGLVSDADEGVGKFIGTLFEP